MGVYLEMEANYGLTFDQVKKVDHPPVTMTRWGTLVECTERPEYALTQICLKPGGTQPLHFYLHKQGAYFVESGEVLVRARDRDGQPYCQKLLPGHIFRSTPGLVHSLCGLKSSVVYGFSNRVPPNDSFSLETEDEAISSFKRIDTIAAPIGTERTFDYRAKYWGSIESILCGDVAGKRIVLKAHCQSSLEFHCAKTETYFVHSGKVKVGLRVGRAENRSVVLEPGDSFDIRPGLMHMRIGLEDSVILEISTRDSDCDSHLVEDGRQYQYSKYQYDET